MTESWDFGPAPIPRKTRVGAEVQHALARLIERYADPRLDLVTVTEVDMSPDLKQARVLVSSVNPAADRKTILSALRHAGSRLRHELAREVRLRTLPWLKFAWDSSSDEREYLDDLIARGLPQGEQQHAGAAVPAAKNADEASESDEDSR